MALLPTPARVKTARQGSTAAGGKLPAGWQGEHADTLAVDHIDMGPDGPAVTLTLGFAAGNPAQFVSVVVGDYLHVENGDVAALRLDVEVSRADAVSEAYVVLREWIAGGTYVGQATRPLALHGELGPAVAARMATGDQRLFQPLVTFKRDGEGDGQVTVRLRRVALASLHDHPAWLSA